MTRRGALNGLVATSAATLVVLIQRHFLARTAERLLLPLGRGFDYWGALAWGFFEDRWALTACVLAVLYFAYRFALASRRDGG